LNETRFRLINQTTDTLTAWVVTSLAMFQEQLESINIYNYLSAN